MFIGLAVLAGAVVTLNVMLPRPGPSTAVAKAKPSRPPAVKEAPKAEVPLPEPARPSARREPAPKPEAAPSLAPAALVEAAPEAGILNIQSDVPGAKIFIDREYIGLTPVTAGNIRPGSHVLNASAQGYDVVADTIEVSPGSRDILIKRYDFTDPQGNADRLFVFHRDVDKARERLKNGDPPASQ